MKYIGITSVRLCLLLSFYSFFSFHSTHAQLLVLDAPHPEVVHEGAVAQADDADEDVEKQCAICFEDHVQLKEPVVTLICNHSFGAACLLQWKKVSQTCPKCRYKLVPKPFANSVVALTCHLCNQRLGANERSMTYTCLYNGSWNWQKETHVFHESCIKPYALRASFISRKTFAHYETAGDIVFACPCEHKDQVLKRCHRPRIKLEELLRCKPPLPAVLPGEVRKRYDEVYPAEPADSVKTACEICHRTVLEEEKKSTYTCTWNDGSWWGGPAKRTHLFHEDCLKPYAEKNAQKRENGEIHFFCPVDHGGVANHDELYVPLLEGFDSPYAKHLCTYCSNEVSKHDPEAVILEYENSSSIIGMSSKVVEKVWCHKPCLAALARVARQEKTSKGEIKYFHSCPYHAGTSLAHEFFIPQEYVPSEDALK